MMSSTASPATSAPQATPAASAPPPSNGAVTQAGSVPVPQAQAPAASVFDTPPPATDTAIPPEAVGGNKPDMRAEAPVDLNFPIEISGVKTGRLTMRRPKLRDRLVIMHTNSAEPMVMQEVRFIANLCGVLPQDIENLDVSDYNRLQDQLASFTVSAPQKTLTTP